MSNAGLEGARKRKTLMAVSLWELLTFTPKELRKREQTMTFQEREAERMEALRRFEETNLQKESSSKNAEQTKH